MRDLRQAAEMALEALSKVMLTSDKGVACENAAKALRQALAQPVDAVPGFTVTEPRQSLSRMKPGDRFVLVRTGEIYRIENDGSQWNETRQRIARLHKNSQVRLIVDAVNMSQKRVDETAKDRHEPVAWLDGGLGVFYWACEFKDRPVPPGFEPLYAAYPRYWSNVTDDALIEEVRRRGFTIRDAQISPKREWVGLTKTEFEEAVEGLEDLEDCWYAIEAKLKEKNCSAANNS